MKAQIRFLTAQEILAKLRGTTLDRHHHSLVCVIAATMVRSSYTGAELFQFVHDAVMTYMAEHERELTIAQLQELMELRAECVHALASDQPEVVADALAYGKTLPG